MQIEVDQQDLRNLRRVERPAVPLADGQARLRVDRFGLSANNVTYAAYGRSMRYWECFPASADAGVLWGVVPVWGFAQVAESRTPGLPEGRRVYGFLPMGDRLVVEPGRIDDRGFSDMAEHRRAIPDVYSRYSFVETDPVYRPEREGQHLLLWPLMVTSFVVDDFLGDHDLFGARTVVVSSASSKTALGAAFCLAARGDVEVIGLTSAANREFVRDVGCYSEACAYEEVSSLPLAPACYVDVAGRADLTRSVHERLGDHLRYSMVVGDTHWDHRPEVTGPPVGPKPVFLFAPDQIAKRRRDWGRDGFEKAVASTWEQFVPWTDRWLELRSSTGPAAVESVFDDLVDGRLDPRVGYVCTLGHPATG